MEKKINNIMVCVTGQKSCERLINRGQERARDGDELFVVHCVHTGRTFMNYAYEPDAIDYLFTAAQLAGAQLTMLRTDNVDDALVDFAQKSGVTLIIMGASPDRDLKSGAETITDRLQRRLPDVEFDIS